MITSLEEGYERGKRGRAFWGRFGGGRGPLAAGRMTAAAVAGRLGREQTLRSKSACKVCPLLRHPFPPALPQTPPDPRPFGTPPSAPSTPPLTSLFQPPPRPALNSPLPCPLPLPRRTNLPPPTPAHPKPPHPLNPARPKPSPPPQPGGAADGARQRRRHHPGLQAVPGKGGFGLGEGEGDRGPTPKSQCSVPAQFSAEANAD